MTPSPSILKLEEFTHIGSEINQASTPDGVRCILEKGVTVEMTSNGVTAYFVTPSERRLAQEETLITVILRHQDS